MVGLVTEEIWLLNDGSDITGEQSKEYGWSTMKGHAVVKNGSNVIGH